MIWRIRERQTFDVCAAMAAGPEPRHCGARYLDDPDAARRGSAFSIGRAVGSAVVRNRLRRRLRAHRRPTLAATHRSAAGWLLSAPARAAELFVRQAPTRTSSRRLDRADDDERAGCAGAAVHAAIAPCA